MKIMMFAHGGSLNRGCEAIIRSSAAMIKDELLDVKISLASERPETDENIKDLDDIFDSTAESFNPNFFEKVICGLELKLFKKDNFALRKLYSKIIKRIKQADVCLSIGGDNYCYGEQPWLYEIDRQIKKRGKKLILWACSMGEEDLTPRMLKDLKRFDWILARESLTYEVLIGKGLNNVKLCADPAFTLNKVELPLLDGWKEGDTIGLNFSPLVSKKNAKAENTIKELIKYILENTQATVALVPHVVIEDNDDYELLKTYYKMFENTGRIILLPNHLNAMEYKGYIARMRCFIGARTHATIAAYSSCVPTMVLGYSIKSRGIAKDLFGEEKLVLGVDSLGEKDKLIRAFETLIMEEEAIRAHLTKVIPQVQQKSYHLMSYIKG